MTPKPKIILALAAAITAVPAVGATNVIPGNVSSISVTGTPGILRSATWSSGSTASDENLPTDGVFAPEMQQWNNGSFWWDQDPSVNQSPVYWEVQLNQAFTVDRFVVQADDNDSYLLEYWDGSAWQNAFAVPFLPSFGLRTRDSGSIAAITTDRFRFSATAGDNYFAVSEIQAFAAVPEPATWAMFILGFGLVGNVLRRRRPTVRLQFV